jgi:isopropylmalate/homocitrate/citramalate synthase
MTGTSENASPADPGGRHVFTSAQVSQMRGALDEFRRGPGYEPGRWKVSDVNRRSDVLGAQPPPRVHIRDLTLRVSEQMSDVALSHQQRLDLLGALVRAGVSSVQTSHFGRGHTLQEMRDEVQVARSIDPECELQYVGVRGLPDLDLAREAGYDMVGVTSGTYLGAALPAYAGAVYHRAWQGRPWHDLRFPRASSEVTDRTRRLVDAAAARGLKVSASVLLLSYADDEFVAQYCRGVADAGATEVTLGDHASGVSPEGFAHFVRVAHEAAPGLEVSAHTHGMFGLASACCLTAGLAGAEVLETSINGFAEGPMQGDLAQVAAGLEMLYGVATGVDLRHLTGLARRAEELIGAGRPADWPITGTGVFDFGNDGDEYAGEFDVDPLIHMSVVPEAVGNSRHRRIGLVSGPWTLWDKLDELGISVQKSDVERILAAARKEMAARGTGLSDDEIRDIATRELGHPPAPPADRAPETQDAAGEAPA